MCEQQFCLKWNNYASSVTATFKELLEQEALCDVTLSTEDKSIKAHRLVLSACSSFFKTIFQDVQACQHSVVFLKDINYEELRGIIEFIYHGEVSVDQESLSKFLLAAGSLRIKGLTEEGRRAKEAVRAVYSKPGASGVEKPRCGTSTSSNSRVNAIPTPLETENTCAIPELSTEGGEEEADEMNEEDEEEEEEEMTEAELKNIHMNLGRNSAGAMVEEEEGEELANGGGGEPAAVMKQFYQEEEEGGPQFGEVSGALVGLGGAGLAGGGSKKTCPYCYQQLSWHALSRHIRDMHRANEDLVTCQYCLKTFRNKNSLGCHIWRFHKRGRDPKGIFNMSSIS